MADEPVEDENPEEPGAIVRAILDGYPELTLNQAAVLAAATQTPWVPGAARAAGVSKVTVYGWLGRLTREQHRKSEVFCEAWPVFARMGEEEHLVHAARMSKEYNDKGNAAAPAIMAKFMQGYDQRFGGHNAAVSIEGQKVKRIVIEHEGEAKT